LELLTSHNKLCVKSTQDHKYIFLHKAPLASVSSGKQ